VIIGADCDKKITIFDLDFKIVTALANISITIHSCCFRVNTYYNKSKYMHVSGKNC